MACLLFLAIQAVRVFGLKSAEDLRPSALERAVPEGTRLSAAGTVYRKEEKEKVTAVFLKDNTVSVRGRHINESKLLVYIRQNLSEKIKTGNIIQVSGEVSFFAPARNPGNFDQKAYYQRQGTHALLWADSLKVLSCESDRIREFLNSLRSRWRLLLKEHLGDYYGSTMSAVLLGEKSGLEDEMKKMYQKNGIGHLLAISGLHMSFIGMGVYSLLRKAGLPFVPAGAVGSGVLVLYLLMIGTGVSALRALIMFLLRIGADMTGRDYDLPTGLSLAAAAVCAWQPLYLADAGFLLSFGAILGLCLFSPVFSEMLTGEKNQTGDRKKDPRAEIRRIPAALAEHLGSSLAVTLMLLELTMYFYFEIPAYSVFLNILVIPVMPLAMGAGIAGLVLCPVSEAAGAGILQICRGVLWFYDTVCAGAGRLPGSRIVTGQPDLFQMILYYSVLFLLAAGFFRLLERRRREKTRFRGGRLLRGTGAAMLLFGAAMAAVCRAGHTDGRKVLVTVLDVGQGDCIHVRSPYGTEYLIDGGSSDVTSAGRYRIEPYLLSRAADCLDYVFVTHGDEDHSGGILELLQGQELGVRIRTLVLPPEEYLDDSLRRLGQTAEENGTRVVGISAGQSLKEDGGFTVSCLAPEPGTGMKPGNAASLVLELRYGSFGMLLTGDVEAEGEKMLMESGRVRPCQVLKAAHHGSGDSGSEPFLELVRPAAAVISAGIDNRYGHPHRETLKRLSEAGCSVYSTQESGAVAVISDGSSIRLKQFIRPGDKGQDPGRSPAEE